MSAKEITCEKSREWMEFLKEKDSKEILEYLKEEVLVRLLEHINICYKARRLYNSLKKLIAVFLSPTSFMTKLLAFGYSIYSLYDLLEPLGILVIV